MPKDKGKKLDLDDRILIGIGLGKGQSFASIARTLNVAASTISREVCTNRTDMNFSKLGDKSKNHCRHKSTCTAKRLCKDDLCTKFCSSCRRHNCNRLCKNYEEITCKKLALPPYVCNPCTQNFNCRYRRWRYRPKDADSKACRRRREARSGIDGEEVILEEVFEEIRLRLSRGQSPAHIWADIGQELPFCARSLYRYVHAGIFGLNAMKLPRAVRYKPRHHDCPVIVNPSLDGRTYADWLSLDETTRQATVQADCVKGLKGESATILTLHFVAWHFQLYLPLKSETTAEVVRAIDALELYCEGTFSRHFATILTDRGTPFLDWESIERGLGGKKRCSLYYCDARHPEQKGACEKNHEELRKIIPKKTPLTDMGACQLATVMSHVNSYSRVSLGGKSPFDLASQTLPRSLFESLGIEKISSRDVILKPELLKNF